MAPLSGLVELYGPEISWAGRIATEQINEQGGVLGRPLELVIVDDGSQPEQAVPAAIRLIEEEQCSTIIGNLLSNSRIAVATQVAEPRKTPYLNFSFYEGSIHSRYFFHFAALPNQQISKMIPYMVEHFGPKIFFAGSNYEWPRGSIDAGKQSLLEVGGEIVGEEYLPLGTQDCSPMLTRLGKSGADVFVPYFAGNDQLNLLTQFTSFGLKHHMAVVMGHYDEAMVAQLPPGIREGFYSSNTYFMGIDTEENRNYLQQLGKLDCINGITPNGNGVLTNFGEGTYLCVHAFAKAAEMAGSMEPEALVDALEQVSVTGPQGTVTMDPTTHHARVNTYLSCCNRDGSFSIVEKFGSIAPVIPDRYKAASNAAQISNTKDTQQGEAKLAITSETSAMSGPNQMAIETAMQILEKADISILAINSNGSIIQANEATTRMFGYQHSELIGLPLNELLPPRFRTMHDHHIRAFIESAEMERDMGNRRDIAAYRKDGSEFPAAATISKFLGPDGWIMVASLRDITEQTEAEEQLTWQATHDPLTDLPNRKLINSRLENALERITQHGQPIALLFLDLDNFKLINDSYGHGVGDEVLIMIAHRLMACLRPGDTVARFGGDEFVILCDKIENEDAVSKISQKVVEVLKQPLQIEGQNLYITASVGVVIAEGDTESAETLLRNADTAMYAAKERGRNRWQLFNETIRTKTTEHLEIANNLRSAITNDELYPRYQPIVDAVTNKIVGAELLLRWRRPEGEVSPAVFIPVAETSGMIMPIGEWVFDQACQTLARWQDIPSKADTFYLSVNVSARQLCEPGIVDAFTKILEKREADPSSIVIEVTETALITDIEYTQQVLHDLCKLGLKVAIDDFGTGYSSLGKLIHLPVDKLKVDRIFVDALGERKDSLAVASAIIHMAHALGLHVIAEGVETAQQLQILRELQCDNIQGYYFYKPLLEHEFIQEMLYQQQAATQDKAQPTQLINQHRITGGNIRGNI
jgi:diguanylate cyclase (GGDEF)-like protein/PAS domain S-box-containing protein